MVIKPMIAAIHSRQLNGLKIIRLIHMRGSIEIKGKYISVPKAVSMPRSKSLKFNADTYVVVVAVVVAVEEEEEEEEASAA
jgi:hypothetical protein